MKERIVHIICPICGRGRILDAVNDVSAVKLQLFGPRHLDKAEWIAKCPKCGNQIGIVTSGNKYEMQRTNA